MINLIKKDLRVNFSNKVTNIMLLILFPFILLSIGFADINVIFMFSTFSFAFTMAKISFVYETRDKSHIFLQSLPVTKRDIVISKYIYMFINFGLGVIYTFIYMWIFGLIGIINAEKIQPSIILSTLGFTIVALSMSMPMQFRFSAKVANFLNMLFFMMIIVLITFTEGEFLRFLNLDFNNLYNKLLIIGGIVAVYFISMGISIGLYKTRKFY